ncbi:c-type cytochrome [Flavobacterium covae]|uniref:cytochrome-c peroxidase n=1 Tax=Flavobacterium covae TaxID=2906076 RepID=UPI001FB6F3BB|nr:cytochrome c peroxidase [Flavobacterium covae]MCJ1807666.1 c-type cytochrome [Flavobacterium covae]
MRKTVFLIPLILVACKKENQENFSKPAEDGRNKSELLIKSSNYFKSISTVAEENISEEKVDLGKRLYFDSSLSKNGTISCNSCHNLENYGVDNKALSLGDTKKLGGRNSPSSIYASLHSMQFWDGRAKDVEEQAGGPLLNPVEHSLPSKAFLEEKLRKNPEYVTLFKNVYPNEKEPITFSNITNAIGSFERKLHPKSRFDSYLDGDENALSDNEKEGLKSFIDNNCVMCHSGVALGGQMIQKFGIYGSYTNLTHSKKVDKGVFERTQKKGDEFMFKVPSLRNAEKTFPYFHDGSVTSLSEAIKIMGKAQLNKDLPEKDVINIEAFLKTLTADVESKYKKS